MEKISNSLREGLKKITKSVFVDEKLIDEIIRDIQRSLLRADVNVQLVFELTEKIKKRALEEETPKNIDKREHLVKIVYEELVKFLGRETKGIEIKKAKPFKIMMVGLYGSGKTTSISKIAHYYKKRGNKVAAIGLDVHRPAAFDQLEQLGEQVNFPVFINREEKDVVKVYKEFKEEYKKYDILFIDTAGRDALSDDLVEELINLEKEVKADERLLVISADIGQAAQKQAEEFHKSVKISGVVVTKMDGTANAGGALSGAAATNAPIKFIGVGEKIDDLEEFDPEGFVSRLLGMGDLKSLLEKAREAIDEETAEDLGKKFLKGEFNFLDLYEQLQAMKKMGPLNKLMDLIPGMGNLNIPKDMLQVQEGKLKKWKFIMQSMTKEELEDPEVLTRSRIDRIAKGSGCTSTEVRELLKQYRQSKKMMKMVKGKDPDKLMKKMQGKLKGLKG